MTLGGRNQGRKEEGSEWKGRGGRQRYKRKGSDLGREEWRKEGREADGEK